MALGFGRKDPAERIIHEKVDDRKLFRHALSSSEMRVMVLISTDRVDETKDLLDKLNVSVDRVLSRVGIITAQVTGPQLREVATSPLTKHVSPNGEWRGATRRSA